MAVGIVDTGRQSDLVATTALEDGVEMTGRDVDEAQHGTDMGGDHLGIFGHGGGRVIALDVEDGSGRVLIAGRGDESVDGGRGQVDKLAHGSSSGSDCHESRAGS